MEDHCCRSLHALAPQTNRLKIGIFMCSSGMHVKMPSGCAQSIPGGRAWSLLGSSRQHEGPCCGVPPHFPTTARCRMASCIWSLCGSYYCATGYGESRLEQLVCSRRSPLGLPEKGTRRSWPFSVGPRGQILSRSGATQLPPCIPFSVVCPCVPPLWGIVTTCDHGGCSLLLDQ